MSAHITRLDCTTVSSPDSLSMLQQLLQGTRSEGAGGPKNVSNVPIFPFASFDGCAINIYVTEILFCFEFDLIRTQPYLFALYQ